MHEVTQITDGIRQVQEARGVYFTVIEGTRRAIIFDCGYGIADNRGWADDFLRVPYTVVNSHGHPDHALGNYQYPSVHIHLADLSLCERVNTYERRRETYLRVAEENGLDKSRADEFAGKGCPEMLPVSDGEIWDLGGRRVEAVHLPGHTRGSIGLLIRDERLLISGDAFNPDMWMFAENHDTLDTLQATLERAIELPFDAYLGGHCTTPIPRDFLREVHENVIRKEIDRDSYAVILGQPTYTMRHSGRYGTSTIAIAAKDARALRKSTSSPPAGE